MDTEILSRIQFGFTIGFHIIFPTLNLGLALFLVVFEGLWLKTKKSHYLEICKFFTKIFAITFGMGVVSGIVLAYELGTNFGPFIQAFGGVIGPLFAYETLTAFFLEAGFLGVMLFGWKRVSPKLHYLATVLVALGTTLSAFWIMAANSWMQTPAGFGLENGVYIPINWYQIIFNPSSLLRLTHMLLAAYATTAFFVAGITGWYLLKQRHLETAKPCFKFAVICAAIILPLQIFVGDLVGLKVLHYQPLKTAAMEAVWETSEGVPFLIFALPDQQNQTNKFEVGIPKLASLINTHHLNGELLGLDSVPPDAQPSVAPVFFTFRIMVGIGTLLLMVALSGIWLLYRKRLYHSKRYLKLCIACAPLGFIATIMGWLTAEIGRQPWVVYGLMKTKDAVSQVPAHHVLISLILFIIVYGFIFGFYLYYLFKLIRKGPLKLDKDEIEHHLFQYMTSERP